MDISELRGWFRGLSGLARYPGMAMGGVEDQEELAAAQEVLTDTERLAVIRPAPAVQRGCLAFVDGVMRYAVVGALKVGGVHVPVVAAHLAAGATRLVSKSLVPALRRGAIVIALPITAITEHTRRGLLPGNAELFEVVGVKSMVGNHDPVLFTDTTKSLQGVRVFKSLSDLAAVGAVIEAARNRLLEVLRAMEFSVVLDMVRESCMVIADGPVANLIKYAGLVDPSLRGIAKPVGDLAVRAYEVLRGVVGVVKRPIKVPSGLATPLGGEYHLYLWGRVVEDRGEGSLDGLRTYILSAFTVLRPELLTEYYPVQSPTAGLVRVDVPLPAVMGRDEWVGWILGNAESVTGSGRESVLAVVRRHTNELSRVLGTVQAFKYPIPSSTPYRRLVELYPIFETELMLKTTILSKYELASLTY